MVHDLDYTLQSIERKLDEANTLKAIELSVLLQTNHNISGSIKMREWLVALYLQKFEG